MEYPPQLPHIHDDLSESSLLASIIEDLQGLNNLPDGTIEKYCTSYRELDNNDKILNWVEQWMTFVSLDSNIMSENDAVVRFITNGDHGYYEDLSAFNTSFTESLTLRKLLSSLERPCDLLSSKYDIVRIFSICIERTGVTIEFDINYPMED